MIYLDHHATTPCDERVVQAFLPWLTQRFGNPHSVSHAMGRDAAAAMDAATESIAGGLNCPADHLLFTSGATESINLALRGVMTHPRNRRRKIVTCTTEHAAVLDVAEDLVSLGFESVQGPVHPHDHALCGQIDLERLCEIADEQTAIVSVMSANNEIGVLQPIREIAAVAHRVGALMHCDATQSIGRLPTDVMADDIDLVSGSAHKFYGPKGIGFLVAGNGRRRVRLRPQIVGGGQQRGLRSGTMNPAGVIAMATALSIASDENDPNRHVESESIRVNRLRDRLWDQLNQSIPGLRLNGPPLERSTARLPGNLNFRLPDIQGETWMATAPEVAFSSGSACSSVNAMPSHVLLALGLSESQARRSVRFGIGRLNSEAEIDRAALILADAYRKLRGQIRP